MATDLKNPSLSRRLKETKVPLNDSLKHDKDVESKELIHTPPMVRIPEAFNDTSSLASDQRKKGQGKLLLVALLENYCMLYDQTKEQNQKLFLVLCQHLCRMGIIDSTDFLEEFSSVRNSYKRAFKELVIKAMATVQQGEKRNKLEYTSSSANSKSTDNMLSIKSNDLLIKTPSEPKRFFVSRFDNCRSFPTLSLNITSNSDLTELMDGPTRFELDFESLDILGRGAFGKVLRARNRLDGCLYAVKIIKAPSDNGPKLLKVVREVKLLAGMDHPNVVGYFSSWLQHMDKMGDDDLTDESDSERGSTGSAIPSIERPHKHLGLFVQMELCDYTLHEWLQHLNSLQWKVDKFRKLEEKILRCFTDILKGTQFIHKKGYIHRDLKPKNIYWKPSSEEDRSQGSNISIEGCPGKWKIGDFGLATWNALPFELSDEKSYGIGTVTYASPEQLEHLNPHAYSFQTDIYSIGIILFELLVPLYTGMERIKTLSDLRNGLLSDDFFTERPKEAGLVLWMMNTDPHLRPTISEILAMEWFNHSDVLFPSDSKEKLLKLEAELMDQQNEISSLKQENTHLKSRIAELESLLKIEKLSI